MTVVLQVRSQSINAEQLIPLLSQYQLLPQLVREIIIDQVIKDIVCTPEELETGYKTFYSQNQISSEPQLEAWLGQMHLCRSQLGQLIERTLRTEKYKRLTWSNKLETYFLQRKSQLDRVIYSLIRLKDGNIAQELFFRLQDGEQTFAELAAAYSQGPEAQTQGITGPVEVGSLPVTLGEMLAIAHPKQLLAPQQIGEWIVLVRLEKRLPAQLDNTLEQRLLNEMFNNWLQGEIKQFYERQHKNQ